MNVLEVQYELSSIASEVMPGGVLCYFVYGEAPHGIWNPYGLPFQIPLFAKKGDPFKYLSPKMTPFNIPNSFLVAPCSEYENIYSKEHTVWSTFCSCLRLSYFQALWMGWATPFKYLRGGIPTLSHFQHENTTPLVWSFLYSPLPIGRSTRYHYSVCLSGFQNKSSAN